MLCFFFYSELLYVIVVIYLFIYLFITFYHSQLVHVSVLSCEHTCTTSQHYNAFQCFIVTAMKTHGDKTDLNLSYTAHPCAPGVAVAVYGSVNQQYPWLDSLQNSEFKLSQ